MISVGRPPNLLRAGVGFSLREEVVARALLAKMAIQDSLWLTLL
jgi:hypothetical protein